MRIPEKHKKTIAALVEADPEVAQATCDIPHLRPETYLIEGDESDDLPFCGCFVGVYEWMQECKAGRPPPLYATAPDTVSSVTKIDEDDIKEFAEWCYTVERDRAAVRYARSLLL